MTLINKHLIWLIVGGGLLGVSQQIAIVVLPLLAKVMAVSYESLVNWQALGSLLFLFSSVFWAKAVAKHGITWVVKVSTVGFLLSNLMLLCLWLNHQWLATTMMLAIFIVSRVCHGVFSSGIVPQLQTSALMLYPHNSVAALAKVALGGTLARCLTPLLCMGLLMFSATWVFALPIVLAMCVLWATPRLAKVQLPLNKARKVTQHRGLLVVALLSAFCLCYGQFSLVHVFARFIPDNSIAVSQWVAGNLALTACLSSFNQLYYIKKRQMNAEKLLIASVAFALLMAGVASLVNSLVAVCVCISLLFMALNSATLAYTNVIVAHTSSQFTNYITLVHTLGYALGALWINFSFAQPFAVICVALSVVFAIIVTRYIRFAYLSQCS
ncbi:MFS transporter [Pseudoalteromonas sp.]|uniref:MFS transporter n=1 Tax=Pseudoalteromonas sp. TaxID=53249 RepID=UPI003567B30C